MSEYDLPGALRRIRRTADLSQRNLARHVGVSKSCIGAAEGGRSGVDVRVFARAAALAGLRLALLDAEGAEVEGMADRTVRDGADRRFPAHLDTRHSDEGWWHGPHRFDRMQPWYTFDRDRGTRDAWRERTGTPDDHQLPQPGDSPRDRAERRCREQARIASEERHRQFLAGEFSAVDLGFECACPPSCDDLDDRSGKPVHAPDCSCDCDVA